MLQSGATVPANCEAWKGLGAVRAKEELGNCGAPLGSLASSDLPLLLQLDSEDAEPNFDEDGQDEYNELHMPV